MVPENEIYIGSLDNPILTITNKSIISCEANLSCSISGEELAIDTLNVIFQYDKMAILFAPADYDSMESADNKDILCKGRNISGIADIAFATPVWYYNAGNYIGKFYVKSVRRTAADKFTLEAFSAIGVLDSHTYYGRLYKDISIADAVSNIFLTDGLESDSTPFMVELASNIVYGPGVEDLAVNGWIPVCTKREALHYILFAHNLTLRKTSDDHLIISWLIDSADVPTISDKEIYNNGTVNFPEPAQRVEVTEHEFRNVPVDRVSLFDNTSGAVANHSIVKFTDAPIIVSSLMVTGSLEILASCPNAAIVSGVGTMDGLPYTHNQTVKYRGAESVVNGTTITCDSNTLINFDNSDNVVDKLWRYYTQRREVTQDIVLKGQLPGEKCKMQNSFGDVVEGYLSQMILNASGIVKAACTMITDYTPPTGGRTVTRSVLLTGTGTWAVPSEVFQKDTPRIHVVLIAGGQGGQSGLKGADGKSNYLSASSYKYATYMGGDNGYDGQGGRVFQFAITGDDLEPIYNFSCGDGGEGALPCESESEPNIGFDGGASTFGGYSSDMGVIMEGGVKNYFNNETYASRNKTRNDEVKCSGPNGGGTTSDPSANSMVISIYDYQKGFYTNFAGTKQASDWKMRHSGNYGGYIDITRGCVGGAAPGEDGVNLGEVGTHGFIIDKNTMKSQTGDGGNGADATRIPSSPLTENPNHYGWGGKGGFGGGVGGNCGLAADGLPLVPGAVGIGGKGGPGGPGAPGCIIVYY